MLNLPGCALPGGLRRGIFVSVTLYPSRLCNERTFWRQEKGLCSGWMEKTACS